MKHFRVVFRKSKWGDGEKIDNVIDIWTAFVNIPYVVWKERFNLKNVWRFLKMNYAHVEIWTPSQIGLIEPRPVDWWNGNMATSTTRGEWDGTVMREAKEVILDRSRWDYAEYEITNEDFRRVEQWSALQVLNNKGYSNQDIGKFIPAVRHFVGDSKRNICSEFCHNWMVIARQFKEFFIVISPRRLAYRVWKEHDKALISLGRK
ncbi:MAG: hypothetical protein FVQ80_11285 [Planctomycetes bacterium]|nr:hypothetical protein [Planctomycetota bacterium]